MSVSGRIVRRLMPAPVNVRHAEYSMLFSADDDRSSPSDELISLAMDAIQSARRISLDHVSVRMKSPPYYPAIWPGEHYRLLSGLVSVLRPKSVVEIGTAEGLSALSMKTTLPAESRITTFDLIDWRSYSGCCLRDSDFEDGRLVQHIDDLTKPSVISGYRLILEEADMIFVDAAKDGVMEEQLLENFDSISFKRNLLVVFDDIRLWKMLRVWRNISSPKLDVTSFGHWSGTGFVAWVSG